MLDLSEKLKEHYDALSSGQKKVAKLFFENPNIIAFTPAFEVGKKAGVSESTVIRLSQTLGYKGYADLQEIVQKEVKKSRTILQHQEMSHISNNQPFFKKIMEEDVQNIQHTMDCLSVGVMEQAVEMIAQAKRIFVTGGLSSFGLAHFFSHWLNMVLRNTEMLYGNEFGNYTQFTQMNPETLVIPITFPRYARSTVDVARFAKDKGAKLLAITDSELSPIKEFSDLLLISPVSSELRIDSYTAPMSLITSLIRTVSVRNHAQVEKHLTEMEEVYEKQGVFFTE